MSNFGFFVKGDAGNLIIDEENPVMALLHSGSILMSTPPVTVSIQYGKRNGRNYNMTGPASWRYCHVTYPTPITSNETPLVFAVPQTDSGKYGLGRFTHLGGPGNWTGFTVVTAPMDLTTPTTNMPIATPIDTAVNYPTGWKWYACSFSAPASNEKYGMRVWAGDSRLVFDSGWQVVPFRNLLSDWRAFRSVELDTTRQFSNGDYLVASVVVEPYWGNNNANTNKDIDEYWHQFSHSWGFPNRTRGVLISSLYAQPIEADNGFQDGYRFYSAGLVGVRGSDRTNLYYTLPVGFLQHIGINPQTVNNFSLMTADFSLIP
jgi:hypothetical protein